MNNISESPRIRSAYGDMQIVARVNRLLRPRRWYGNRNWYRRNEFGDDESHCGPSSRNVCREEKGEEKKEEQEGFRVQVEQSEDLRLMCTCVRILRTWVEQDRCESKRVQRLGRFSTGCPVSTRSLMSLVFCQQPCTQKSAMYTSPAGMFGLVWLSRPWWRATAPLLWISSCRSVARYCCTAIIRRLLHTKM